jgi:hypothetical protein
MNSDLTREGAKVAGSVVEGLKSQPLSLALIVMNIVFVLFITWLAHTINQRTESQYRVKDEQTALLLAKLDQIAEVRVEVRAVGERVAANTVMTNNIAASVERLTRIEEDHEKRLRDLERQKQQ